MIKKKYGQHFLINKEICKKITEKLSFKKYNELIEIGPGKGALTKFIDYDKTTLIEIDNDCVKYIKNNFPKFKNKIIQKDFLKIENKYFKNKKIGIIGNFPYNISSQIVFKIIENKKNIFEVVGMFQKELAERICSKEGSKKYGIISVLTQLYYNTEYLFEVNQDQFFPKPKVMSAVIRLQKKEKINYKINETKIKKILKTSFNQRRKKLKNSLSKINFHLEKENNIFDKRPEQLSLEEFIFLSQNIKNEI